MFGLGCDTQSCQDFQVWETRKSCFVLLVNLFREVRSSTQSNLDDTPKSY